LAFRNAVDSASYRAYREKSLDKAIHVASGAFINKAHEVGLSLWKIVILLGLLPLILSIPILSLKIVLIVI
jgi:hypothetical protein